MRLTTCVLLPCLHSWLQDLSVEKEEKENQIFQFAVIEVRERLLLGTHTQGTYIALRLSITFLGVDDPCLRQHMRILALRKKQIQLDNCCHCNGSTNGRWDKNTHKM